MRRLGLLVLLGLLAAGPAGCGAIGDRVTEVRESAEDASDRVQFCASAVRVATALSERDLAAAETAARDAAAEAPDEIRPQLRVVLDGVEAARSGDEEALQDPDFQRAAEQVASYARDTCDPTG